MAAKRKVNTKSSYSKTLEQVRKRLPTSTVEIEIETIGIHRKDIDSSIEHSRIIRNTTVAEVYKNYKQMIRTKEYKDLKLAYKKACEKEEEEKRKEIGEKLEKLQNKHNITFEFTRKYAEKLQKQFSKAQAVIALTTAEFVWKSIEGSDLYSAFLMYCSDQNLVKPDQNLCFSHFEEFLKLHDLCIEEIKNKRIRVCNSGIKIA